VLSTSRWLRRATFPAVLVGGLVISVPGVRAAEVPPATALHHHHAAAMSDAEMKRDVEAWFAAHPRVGVSSVAAAADTFTVVSFRFDTDGNSSTQIDTAKIDVGQTILWRWLSGFHTTTSGTGGTDPDAGVLWDQPMDSGHATFSFTFNTPGTFDFFCRPHEGIDMKGVVLVRPPANVTPPLRASVGFVQGPTPNPTRTGVSYAFALARPGVARVEVFDEAGRRVAVVQSTSLEAGVHSGSWNARAANGARVTSGRYFLRLRAPGIDQSRSFTIAR
jgi:plastocyanin